MNKPNKTEKDHVNVKLQKTISNLISNVISSLCQQVVQYERSIDIFGLLCINIDEDIDISVKLNEKFIKKETVETNSNVNSTKLVETLQKSDANKVGEGEINEVENEQSDLNEEMETDNKENDCLLIVNESEKSLIQKRRPRKPQQTFRHIVVDDIQYSKESDKSKIESPVTENELKIDAPFDGKCNKKMHKNDSHFVKNESISKSMETDESEDKLNGKSSESMAKISPSSSIINVDDSVNKNSDSIQTTSKMSQSYKCTICDRQFKRKFCLTRHKRVHQNYKTYLCNICGQGFDLINQLKRHLRNAHACSRENLRRSCRNNQKSEGILKSDQFCQIECAWPMPKVASQMPLLPAKQTIVSTNSVDSLNTKPLCFNQFSFPPGLIVANSGKKQNSSTFSQTFTPPTSASTQYQVRQMFNSIMSANDASLPYSSALYYMQNFAHMLPTSTSALFHHPVTISSTIKSMPNLSSAPQTSNMSLANTCSQRLPIYRFPSSLFTSPSLKSIPLNNSWNNTGRPSDSSYQSDKLKQSSSPTSMGNQLQKMPD